MSTYAVIIVNYNGLPHLPECLRALRAQSLAPKAVAVVDNASTDGSREWLRANDAGLMLIANPRNEGFCRAVNTGIRAAAPEADYVLVLNPDAAPEPDYAKNLVAAMDARPESAAAAGKLLRADGGTIDSAGLGLTRALTARDRGAGKPDDGRFEAPAEVFSVCAAAAMYRVRALEQVRSRHGFFDERYFMYGEDLELGWRARRGGFSCLYVPSARAQHVRGTSQPHRFFRKDVFYQFHCLKNRYLTLLEHAPAKLFVRTLPWWAGCEIGLMIYILVCRPRLAGVYVWLFKNAREIFNNRRENWKKQSVPDRDFLPLIRIK